MPRVNLLTGDTEQALLADILEVLGIEHRFMDPDLLLSIADPNDFNTNGVLIISESGLLALESLVGGDYRKIRDVLLRFREVLVFPLNGSERTAAVLGTVIGGTVAFRRFDDDRQSYSISTDRARCGPFAGLSFGLIKPQRDRGICVASQNAVRKLVSIGDTALMAQIAIGKT